MSDRERHKCLDVLGLSHSSSEDDIKKAYRRLAKQFHPDKNTDDGAKEQFQEISYAYKYLIEGPDAVGADDEDDGIPLDILVRLFPWMFAGGSPFHHRMHPGYFQHYHHPFFPGFHGRMYDDSDDDDEYYYDDGDEYIYCDSRPKSMYDPGPSKEDRRKEKKKKAKERKKAAKKSKAQATTTPQRDSHETKQTFTPEKTDVKDPPGEHLLNGNKKAKSPEKPDKCEEAESTKTKSRGSDLQNGSHDGSASLQESPVQQTQTKPSKKKLKQEQKKREKEMEMIANEFMKQQKEKAEKEAQKETKRRERMEKTLFEKAEGGDYSIDETDSIITSCDDSESVRTDLDAEDHEARDEVDEDEYNMDDVGDADEDGLAKNLDDRDKKISGVKAKNKRSNEESKRNSSNQKTNREKNGSHSNIPVVSNSSKVTHTSRYDGGHQTRQGHKTHCKDNRSSSRGDERNTTGAHIDRPASVSKKFKRHGRTKEADLEEWEDLCDGKSPYESLQPQTEAEEMRMFHEAVLRSEREAMEKGVIPATEEEERRMLEAALRESQMTAHWSGNMDTLDDVSDGEQGSSLFSGAASSLEGAGIGDWHTSLEGAGIGDWHTSIGKKTSFNPQDKENITPGVKVADASITLGGFGNSSSGFRSPLNSVHKDVSKSDNSSRNQFDKAVGGKVKSKARSDERHKAADPWEFGGAKGRKPFQMSNEQGLQFGLDDVADDVDLMNSSQVPEWARQIRGDGASSSYSNNHGKVDSKHKVQNRSHVSQPECFPSSERFQRPEKHAQQTTSQFIPSNNLSSGASGPAAARRKAAVDVGVPCYGDMDDIDDVDTFENSNGPVFSSTAEPASNFDLNIPAAFRINKIKSYYQRKK